MMHKSQWKKYTKDHSWNQHILLQFLKKWLIIKVEKISTLIELDDDDGVLSSLSFQFFAYGKANNLVPINFGPGDR